MIYAFLSDEAFANIKASDASVFKYSTISSNALGMLDDNLLNYFVDHELMSDPVGSRWASNRETRLPGLNLSNVGTPIGRMVLHFDGSKLDPNVDFISTFEIDPLNDEDTVIRDKALRRAALFNIIETIYMSRYRSDRLSSPKSEEDIDAYLASNATGIESTYYGYEQGSLQLSPTTSRASYRYTTGDNNGNQVESITIEYEFWDYFSFDFKVKTLDGVDHIQSFKIWLDPVQFKAEYPYSTITKVVYPCSPAWILDPSNRGSEMQAVLAAAQYKDAALDDEITKDDHSGISLFVSRYVHSSVSSNARMSFVVMYKGAPPTAAAMREAVRDALLAEVDSNKNTLGAPATWAERLPDLFVDASFYLFPCYYQRENVTGGKIVENNIANYRKLYEKARCLCPDMDPQALFERMEIIQVPGHRIYVIVLPFIENVEDKRSLLKLFPNYQALDSIGESYRYTLTRDTKWVRGKYYYVKEDIDKAPIYAYNRIDIGVDDIGGAIPSDMLDKVYERETVSIGYWDTMPINTKELAQMLSICYTVCLDGDDTGTKVDAEIIKNNKAKFTEETIDGRQYYSFVTNHIELHMISRVGGVGVLDSVATGCEHTENIH